MRRTGSQAPSSPRGADDVGSEDQGPSFRQSWRTAATVAGMYERTAVSSNMAQAVSEIQAEGPPHRSRTAVALTSIPVRRYAELITERTVERFLTRLFLREARLRGLCVVSPFIAAMAGSRFGLAELRKKVERERIPTYVITREPTERYQQDAMDLLAGSPWIELRYNASVHAKVYVASAEREAESFALFGSGNLTAQSIESNIELAMMVYSEGPGREILRELCYWATARLRTLRESTLIQPVRATRR